MNEITSQTLARLIAAAAYRIAQNRDALNRLDAALGDGDHGTNASRAFSLATDSIKALQNPSPSDIWTATAKSLMNGMGGASGALFGTLFSKSLEPIRGKQTLTKSDMNAIWQTGLAGLKSRGKASLGDKTMLDALEPAAQAFAQQHDFKAAWQAAASAARQGAESTRDLAAKQGRAKYLGPRSIGHQDPGANTIALIFEAIRDAWEE